MRGDAAPPEFVDVQGGRIRVRLDGDPAGDVVMFSNSLATDLEMWAGQAARLAPRYRVLRYDTRGHGLSDVGSLPYSIELLADDVVAILDALRIRRAVFVGLSLGGMVGQKVCARHPERFSAAVLCATAMRMDAAVWNERIRLVERDGLEPLVEPTLGRWFTPAFRAAAPDRMEQVRGMIRGTAALGWTGCAGAIRDMDLEADARRLAIPTLVVVGADDPSTPPSSAAAIQACVPGARLEVIERAAHLPNIEQEQVFNALLEQFLARHAAH